MHDTRELLLEACSFPAVKRDQLTTLQVNLGYLCNLSCTHCHVNAGPTRKELMTKETIDSLLGFVEKNKIQMLDLTGGAPEMNPHFRYLVTEARALGVEVINRCNLTILMEPGYEGLAEFLVANKVVITASLPCYLEENVTRQRGKGVYDASIIALRKLNKLGYGNAPELRLNLVYNPVGNHLPPPQESLELDYKRELKERFDVVFNDLYTITNMPISRFGSVLLSKGEFGSYMTLLKDNFSASNLQTVMCRSLISVDWQGYIYDCDFNQMLDFPFSLSRGNLIASDGKKVHIDELFDVDLENNPIFVAEHCYACTAGQGSSCGGALDD